jgi:hypothetical protein
MSEIKTNACEFLSGEREKLELPFSYKIRSKIYSIFRRFISMDEFEWGLYNIHYRAEIAWNNRFFTEDLSTIDFKFIEGKIYILGDCKPLNLTCRCVYEAVYNLPSFTSFAEIGVGGGRFTANLRTMIGEHVRFSAYDISEKQLLFFKEQYPDVYSKITVGVLDLIEKCIPEAEKPDVVLASAVLMHIQRPEAYQRALHNLLQSGQKYIVLMDNWNAHDHFSDLNKLVHKGNLYIYDSGANIAIIINLTNEILDFPYQPLNSGAVLGKYMLGYKYPR